MSRSCNIVTKLLCQACFFFPVEAALRDLIICLGEENYMQKTSNIKVSGLVCMTKEEAFRHENAILKGNKALSDYDQSIAVVTEQA